MFETIVWATDGSEIASESLPALTELALEHGSSIVAVHVNQRFRGGRFGGGPLLADEDDLVAKITQQVADLREAGIEATLQVETSDKHNVAALVAEAAKELDADLIVAGTHGRSAAASTVLGSVAKGLLTEARCPVLVVPVLHAAASTRMRETALAG